MIYSLQNLKNAFEISDSITLLRTAVDIAIVEYDGYNCQCSVLIGELLEALGSRKSKIKEIIIHGKNKIKIKRLNSFIERRLPDAKFTYTGLCDTKRFEFGPLMRMLCIHILPEPQEDSDRANLLRELNGIDNVRYMYQVIVLSKCLSSEGVVSFEVSKNCDLETREMPQIPLAKELPAFCRERRESFQRLIDKSFMEAAFEQCCNEIHSGCEKCQDANNYGEKCECPYFQLKLSEFYRNGDFVPHSDVLAYIWEKQSAKQGYAPAMKRLASDMVQGKGCEADLNQAEKIYSEFALKGDMDCARELATIYNADDNSYRAVPWIARLAKSGDYDMQNQMIALYSYGGRGIEVNESLAQGWIITAAKSGNTGCVKDLAIKCEGEKDWVNALRWYCLLREINSEEDYTKKIEEIFVKSISNLNSDEVAKQGDLYYDGIDTEVDYRRAFLCYEKAYADGSLCGLSGMAKCYNFGHGVGRDEDYAEELWEKAAYAGDLSGLIRMYEYVEDSKDQDNPWLNDLKQSIEAGVESNNIRAILAKANYMLYGSYTIYGKNRDQAYQLFCKAKNLGSVSALRSVGMCLCLGYGTEKSYPQAQALFKEAALRGEASAMRCLGCTYKHGYGNVEKDEVQSFEWYLRAAERNDVQSQKLVGDYFKRKDDLVSANKWWLKAAENGNSSAQSIIGENFYRGLGIKKDLVSARKWCEKAADAGEKDAYFRTAYMCDAGEGGSKDYEKAFRLYSLLVADGNSTAMNNLGVMYSAGRGVEADAGKASELYLKSAMRGDDVAMRNIAMRYKNGIGIEKDFKKFLSWSEKGLEANYSRCGIDLAELYRWGDSGEGIDVDVTKAISILERVVSIGSDVKENKSSYETALMMLADIYYRGQGVEVNDSLAFEYHRKAAESGVVKAYYMLGEHYKYGYGVGSDQNLAVFWYRKAAEKGYHNAIERLDDLGADYIEAEG